MKHVSQEKKGKIADLNKFHEKWNTLPMSEGKNIVSLFITAMMCASHVEEF